MDGWMDGWGGGEGGWIKLQAFDCGGI
jgi:hypothetical protein